MNKKGLSAIIATVLIILIVIVGVVLVWIPIRELLNEPHFKITKEECRNDITMQKFIDAGGKVNRTILKSGAIAFTFYSPLFYCEDCGDDWLKNTFKETCKDIKVELEEFYGYDYCDIKGYGEDCYNSFDLRTIEEREAFRLTKEEISIEWLDENCEPNYDSAVKKCEKQNEIIEVCPIKYFKEYKCGKYTVEVWN